MVIIAIIAAFIAVIVCLVCAVLSFIADEYVSGVFMAILVVLNTLLMSKNIARYNDEPQISVEENVVEYKVDSTITINGADTLKTYKITYIK